MLDMGAQMPVGPRRWWPAGWDRWFLPSIGCAYVLGGVAFLAVAFGGATALTEPLRAGSALGLSVIAGVLAAGIPSLLFLTGIRTIGGTRTVIQMLFEPVVGVALAAALLDEGILPIQALGGLAILAAAVLLQRSGAPLAPTALAGSTLATGVER